METPWVFASGVFGIIVPLGDPVSEKLQYFAGHRSWHTRWLRAARPFDCKTSPNHQPSITVLYSWYEMFAMTCCVWRWPNMSSCIMAKRLCSGLLVCSGQFSCTFANLRRVPMLSWYFKPNVFMLSSKCASLTVGWIAGMPTPRKIFKILQIDSI